MNKYLIVKWDTNDADYIYEIVDYTKLIESWKKYGMDVELLLEKWIKAMKDKQVEMWKDYWNNWWLSEYSHTKIEDVYEGIFTEEEIGWINDSLVPWWFEGIHDIVSIDYIEGDMLNLFTYRLWR